MLKILQKFSPYSILFFDIETVPIAWNDETQKIEILGAWSYHRRNVQNNKSTDIEEDFFDYASLYPEFSKVLCISCGRLDPERKFIKLKSFYDLDEKRLLTDFSNSLETLYGEKQWKYTLGGYAIKVFDIPFIIRRCLVNEVKIPPKFDSSHLRPWEVDHLDLAKVWQGSSLHPVPLSSVCHSLNIQSPKKVMDGSMVGRHYLFGEGSLEQRIQDISGYCDCDLMATMGVASKLLATAQDV